MDHHKNAELRAKPEKDKAVFIFGMLGVIDQKRMLVREYSFGFFERDPVFPPVLRFLGGVPLEP